MKNKLLPKTKGAVSRKKLTPAPKVKKKPLFKWVVAIRTTDFSEMFAFNRESDARGFMKDCLKKGCEAMIAKMEGKE